MTSLNNEVKQVGVVAVMSGDKILMGKRQDNGKWTNPGGHLEGKEDPKEGALRELKEEAGLEHDDAKKMVSKKVTTPDGVKLVVHAYKVEHDGQKPNSKNDPDEEVKKWEWIDTKNMPKKVLNNLHSPKNVILQKLGIIKSLIEGLVKSQPHKYIRKYKRGDTWIYVYHEGDQQPRRIPEEAIKRIKELAEMGHEDARALHESIGAYSEPKLQMLRELADMGNVEAKKHLKEQHGIDRDQEKLEDKNEPKKEDEKSKNNPRELLKQPTDDYINARESDISNMGEDVKGSARHKRLFTIAQLKDNQAEIKLKDILKAEPINLIDDVSKNNPINPYVCQMIVNKFPQTIKNEKERELYLNTLDEIKKMAIELSKPKYASMDYIDIMKSFKSHIKKVFDETQSKHESAEFLIDYYNKTLSSSPKRGNVSNNLSEYNSVIRQSGKKFVDFLMSDEGVNITKRLIEGDSLNDVFEVNKEAKKRLSMVEYYTSDASRVGPSTGLNNIKDQEKFLTKSCELRAVQWGNSVTDAEREHHLKFSAEAFKDLKDITGLPEKMISFNGRLALAIGARGKGNALAHYEPDKVIINLTRAKGVGSLAHEWGHFLDNILAKTHNVTNVHESNQFLSEAARWSLGEQSEVQQSMKSLVTSDAWKEFDATTRKMLIASQELGMSVGDASYWLSPREMFARAFEGYVQAKLKLNNRENTYLSGISEGNLFQPEPDTMKKMIPLFDDFFVKLNKSEYIEKAIRLIVNA